MLFAKPRLRNYDNRKLLKLRKFFNQTFWVDKNWIHRKMIKEHRYQSLMVIFKKFLFKINVTLKIIVIMYSHPKNISKKVQKISLSDYLCLFNFKINLDGAFFLFHRFLQQRKGLCHYEHTKHHQLFPFLSSPQSLKLHYLVWRIK